MRSVFSVLLLLSDVINFQKEFKTDDFLTIHCDFLVAWYSVPAPEYGLAQT